MRRPRHTVTILFTDIEGFSALMQKDEENAMKVIDRYLKTMKRELRRYGGQLIKNYGDGSLCIFSSSSNAIACAASIQQSLSKGPNIPVRIGVHKGDIVHKKGDVYGHAVNVASRIESISPPGSVLISGSVYEDVRTHPNYHFISFGSHDFKNVSGSINVYSLVNSELAKTKISNLQNQIVEKFLYSLARQAFFSIW